MFYTCCSESRSASFEFSRSASSPPPHHTYPNNIFVAWRVNIDDAAVLVVVVLVVAVGELRRVEVAVVELRRPEVAAAALVVLGVDDLLGRRRVVRAPRTVPTTLLAPRLFLFLFFCAARPPPGPAARPAARPAGRPAARPAACGGHVERNDYLVTFRIGTIIK